MNYKIDFETISSDNSNIVNTMKPTYSTNIKLMCGIIEYNGRTYYLDLNDKDRIINSKKGFVFVNEDDTYPSYPMNYKRVNYLDFIYNINQEKSHYSRKFHKLNIFYKIKIFKYTKHSLSTLHIYFAFFLHIFLDKFAFVDNILLLQSHLDSNFLLTIVLSE